LVAARGGRVILVCQSSLVRLLSKLSNVERVVAVEDTLPSFEAHCPLMSLPNAFDTDLNSIPASAPYIKADPVLVQDWAVRLDSNRGRMKIGLAWAGSSTHLNDRNRSISLAKLFPITNVENAVFFSLQKGEAAEQISRSGASVVDFTSDLKDFADTAAFIANLDLIVSVDTAVAHLAGAMGKQVWVLLPFIPDWRWLLDREDSPWYPTMRLFRQKRAGDWEEPIQRIVNELTTLLKQS
jgi:ADP-heptose:LPS heptosyltransferase